MLAPCSPGFRRPALLAGSLLLIASAFAQTQEPEPAPITHLSPFTVSTLYAAIDVRFRLSGTDLFNPLADTVESAEVVAVQIRDAEDTPEIKVHDAIVSIDGVKLKGLTLSQIATLLDNARKKGVPAWELNSLPATTIRFDGDWLIPLLELKR